MERFINHKDLGKVEVLMSHQRTEDGKDLPKVVALATSATRPHISEKWKNYGEVTFRTAYNNQGNIVKHHYLIWGTDDNFRESGFQHCIQIPSNLSRMKILIIQFGFQSIQIQSLLLDHINLNQLDRVHTLQPVWLDLHQMLDLFQLKSLLAIY